MKLTIKLLTAILALALLLLLYTTFLERKLLVVKTESAFTAQSADASVRVVQFTDTHLGAFFSLEQLRKVVDKINAQKPDVVIFTGDLFDKAFQYDDKDAVADVLAQVEAPLAKLAVYGNRDYGGGAVRIYAQLMQTAGFTVLVDESVQLAVGAKTLAVYGADDALMGNPDADALMGAARAEDFNILVTHEPDAVNDYAAYPVDLALSGHSHGGQINLPFYGAPVKTTMCEDYYKGWYTLENARKTRLYVSSGLGNTKVPFRFGNIPEIVVFDIGL